MKIVGWVSTAKGAADKAEQKAFRYHAKQLGLTVRKSNVYLRMLEACTVEPPEGCEDLNDTEAHYIHRELTRRMRRYRTLRRQREEAKAAGEAFARMMQESAP